jgi:hypothetical protein
MQGSEMKYKGNSKENNTYNFLLINIKTPPNLKHVILGNN